MPKKKPEGEEKRERGQPRSFPTEELFKNKFIEYIQHCIEKKRFPNIAGFCAFTWITRETFYKQEEYYSDTYNKIRCMLEDEILQDNSYRMQLYLKNTFGYTDKQTIDQTIKGEMTITVTGEVKEWGK